MSNFNFMYVMKKFLCLTFFAILLVCNGFAQNSYTYARYGVINQYTNNMVLAVDDSLVISKKKDNSFSIQIFEPLFKNGPSYTLNVSLKGYNELTAMYIYIGEAIQGKLAKGKCSIISFNKLDIYLKNQGYDTNDETYNNNFSFTAYLKDMEILGDKYHHIPDDFIRIFPIKNKPIMGENEKLLREKREQEWKEKEIKEIKTILKEVDIDKKISSIQDNMIAYYQQKTKDIIMNISLEQLLRERTGKKKTASLHYKFDLHINKNGKVTIFKDECNYNFSYYNYDFDKPFGDYRRKNVDPVELSIRNKCSDRYYLDNHAYYKLDKDIFIEDYEFSHKFIFETDILGVKVKNDDFKYYANPKGLPEELDKVNDWCSKNLINNGYYFIHYIIIDGELLTCRILDVNKKQAKDLKQYLK